MAKKLKAGIIGVGGISAVHYAGYVQSGAAEVYALCDIKPDVLKKRSEEYKVPMERCFRDHRDLLKLKEIDAVSVCTPNRAHCEITINALKAGKHVLCEKPMAMDPAEAKRMVATAAARKKKLQIGLMQRFRQDAGFIQSLVQDGTLGKVYYARCQSVRRRGVPSWGVFGQLDKQGGGGLIDIGVHQIDLTWWMMGKPEPVSVCGASYRTIGDTPGHAGEFGAWDWKTYTVEDFTCALVRFKGGATMVIECGFCANIEREAHNSVIVGDKGGASLEPLQIVTEAQGHLMDCTPRHFVTTDLHGVPMRYGTHELEVAAFCESILKNKPVRVPGSEAIITQRIIDGIYRSAKAGREVKV